MKKAFKKLGPALLLMASIVYAHSAAVAADLRQGVPETAYMAVWGRHNPERDYQKAYFEGIWNTVQETGIIEKTIEIVTSKIPQDDLEQAQGVLNEIKEAVAPIDWGKVHTCEEAVYAQTMEFPMSHHLVLCRMTPEAVAQCMQAVENVFGLIEKYSGGDVPVQTAEEDGTKFVTLELPGEVPIRPLFAQMEDVLVFSTSEALAKQSLEMLGGSGGTSKFDDPRLKKALEKLPEPEDSLMFYDAKLQFSQLRGMGDFIRQQSNEDEDAERIADIMATIYDETAIVDYTVMVEYTEGYQNHAMVLGELQPDWEDKLLGKAFGSGESFEDWASWIPANARTFSLSTGANLHVFYEFAVNFLQEKVPEAQPFLDEFERQQKKIGVHLDRDILQAFSGESVSVALPAAIPSLTGGNDSMTALKCDKPERIRELLHRLVDTVKEHPAVKAQQLKLTESTTLEGFEEVAATMLMMFGARPVIGFRDGWMYVGSNASAVERILKVKAGEADNILTADRFQRFGMEIEGPVDAISYSNLAESIRGAAQMMGQVGMLLPGILAMSGVDQEAEEMAVVQEVLGLLPSVAQIIAKFDFYEQKLSVTQEGEDPNTFVQHTITLIRSPEEGADASTQP